MSSPELIALAETIMRTTRVEGPTMFAVGRVRVPPQTGGPTSGVVYVSGVLTQEFAVQRASWASPFITAMAGTTPPNGKRVLVLFVNAQPLLLCTIGD